MASLQQIAGASALIGLITKIRSGIPTGILPEGFWNIVRNITGDSGTYERVEGTRQTARQAHYGSPSQRRNLIGLSDQPCRLIHAIEHILHNTAVLVQLLSDKTDVQALGEQEIARQTRIFKQRFANLRLGAVYSMLANGAIYFDSEGNLLPSSSGAAVTVDFAVPAANKDQLGGIIGASWATAGTDIVGDVSAIKLAAIQGTGYPITTAFYGKNILALLLGNTVIKALIDNSNSMTETVAAGEIPKGLLGLDWKPVLTAHYVDDDGTTQEFFDGDNITFTPDVGPDWYEMLIGSYPVPRSVDQTHADAESAVADIMIATGMFSFATREKDPVTIKQIAGDTFLPVLKVPAAIYIAHTTP